MTTQRSALHRLVSPPIYASPRFCQLLWPLLTSHHCQLVDDEISPGKSFSLYPIPAASTIERFWYSSDIAMMWLLTQITMPHILHIVKTIHRIVFASHHSFTVRQYRILPFGFLQCLGRPKPPCHLLMLQGVTLAHKGLAPSGLSSKFIISENLIIFTIQGTHKQ